MRIITHTDLDGLISAYLICKKFDIKEPEIVTAEPGEVQAGDIKFGKDDIVCDLPQPRGKDSKAVKVKLWFDHHSESNIKNTVQEGKYEKAKSCAQVIYDYFKMNGEEEMLKEVNRTDSADFTRENIDEENTAYFISWALSSKDAEEDLLFFKHVLKRLIEHGYKNVIDDVIKLRAAPRIEKMKLSRLRIKKLLKVKNDIGILDMRKEEDSKSFDKFYPFVLKPQIKYLIRLQRGPENKVRVGVSRNLFDKSETSVSAQEICQMFGGGGHQHASGFDSTFDKVDEDLERVIEELEDMIEEDKT